LALFGRRPPERVVGHRHRWRPKTCTGPDSVKERYPFKTIAICVLPDHLHAVWSLPRDDTDFPLRWSLIKSGFSRGLPGDMQRSSSKIA
jgi:hypothetical protein